MMELLEKLRIVHSYTGLFHLIVALLAMLFGTWVLLMKKGTRLHKHMGWAYVTTMLLMNGSAFAIYNFGGFSLFHGFALVSLAGLVLGIWPAIRRKSPGWFGRHFYFMSWSVVGLYCAFWSEMGTRMVNMQYFWWTVMLATVLTTVVGARVIKREAKKLKLA